MDSTICDSTSFVMLKSFAIADIAGATMEEETGEMKVKEETTIVAAHLCPVDQFFGF